MRSFAVIVATSVATALLSTGCGARRVIVPDVKGSNVRAAFTHLRRAGLRVTISVPFNVAFNRLPVVSRQRPHAGARVEHATAVSLALRPGPVGLPACSAGAWEVPRVTGLLLSRALARLNAAGLRCWLVHDRLVVRDATARDLFDAFRVWAQRSRGSGVVGLRVRPVKSLTL